MRSGKTIGAISLLAALIAVASHAIAIDEIAEKRMISRGGVLYPNTGDSSQDIFQTPPDARALFPPGTLVGVLPADCTSASSGAVGSFYQCDNDFALKEEVLEDGRTVYRVIEKP